MNQKNESQKPSSETFTKINPNPSAAIKTDGAQKYDMSTNKNPIICVDFDGVIHSYTSGWQGADIVADDPVPGAIEWLCDHLPIPEAISAMGPEYVGPEVVIYSARSGQAGGIKAMQDWLMKHGMHKAYFYDDILKFPKTKPPAFLTLDDRAICFNGRFPTNEEMLGFVPWNKLDVAGAPVLGATGKFPDGKMSAEDEGELQLGVAHDQDNVVIDFGTPTAWIALPREMAIDFAKIIVEHAMQIRP